jgi:hypothetical protein
MNSRWASCITQGPYGDTCLICKRGPAREPPLVNFCLHFTRSPFYLNQENQSPRPNKRNLLAHWSTMRPCLSKCIRKGLNHSRAIHAISQPGPLSIAHLLDEGTQNPESVIVNGFIRSIRNQKQRSFASIGDGSSLEPLQALLTPEQAKRFEFYSTNAFSHARHEC